MTIETKLTDVPPGKTAAIVTYLQMRSRPPLRKAPDLAATVRRVETPDTDWYRGLYERVGAMDWLWFIRLQLSEAELDAVITDPGIEIYALTIDGKDEGLAELDFRSNGECQLAYFGVTGRLIGCGAGRLLMNEAISRAWSKPISRFWVHTCTHDHPGALAFYRRSGFEAYRQQVDIADDPRLAGLLPETAAPHIPLIRE